MYSINVDDRQLNPRKINRCTITLLSTNMVKKQFSTRLIIDFPPLFLESSPNRLERSLNSHLDTWSDAKRFVMIVN